LTFYRCFFKAVLPSGGGLASLLERLANRFNLALVVLASLFERLVEVHLVFCVLCVLCGVVCLVLCCVFLCCGVVGLCCVGVGAWLQLGHDKNNQALGLSCVFY